MNTSHESRVYFGLQLYCGDPDVVSDTQFKRKQKGEDQRMDERNGEPRSGIKNKNKKIINTELLWSDAAVKWEPCVWKRILQPDCHAEELRVSRKITNKSKLPSWRWLKTNWGWVHTASLCQRRSIGCTALSVEDLSWPPCLSQGNIIYT